MILKQMILKQSLFFSLVLVLTGGIAPAQQPVATPTPAASGEQPVNDGGKIPTTCAFSQMR